MPELANRRERIGKKTLIANVVFDERLGGPQRRIVSVARGLVEHGFETILIKPPGGDATEALALDNGVQTQSADLQRPSGLLSPRGLLRFAAGSARDVFRFRTIFSDVDLVHVNGAFFVAPAIAGRLARKRVVWHLNDTMLPRPIARGLGMIVKLVAHEVVAAAQAVADYYGVTNAEIIHAPVNVDRFLPIDGSRDHTSAKVIGILGNWAEIKGYDKYVEVLAAIAADGIAISGLAIGGYPESQQSYRDAVLRKAEASGVAALLDDRGFVADPSELVASMDVLLLTSQSEASPTCVLEAMACGVPVVAFDVGGVREMLGVDRHAVRGASGAVVSQGDVAAMVAETTALLHDAELWRRCSDNAVIRAREDFSVDACVGRHARVYRRLTGG